MPLSSRIAMLLVLLCMSSITMASAIKCKLNYASLEADHLKCLRNETIVSSIRKNFLEAKALKKSCSKCREVFPDSVKFQNLFHQPLMALEIDTKDFGGYWVFVIFRRDTKLYRLWLYEIDEGDFQLREIKRIEMSHLLKSKFKDLSTDQFFASYWID